MSYCVSCASLRVRLAMFAVLSATRTQHSEHYTHHTSDMLPHYRVTYNDVVFKLNLNLI